MANNENESPARKPLDWIGSSRKDLKEFPKRVRWVFGQALDDAQVGGKHPNAKPLKGFKGAGVLEVVESYDGDAYRAVYTVKFAGIVYVLHAFQKKSNSGRKTPPGDINTIHVRLKEAEKRYAEWARQQEKEEHP